jgi:hypothetical protein
VFGAWSCGQVLQQCPALPHLCSSSQGCTHMCMCEKSDTAHVRSSRCAIPHIQPRARSYTPMHTCMPCTYTYLHSSAQRNSIYHAQACPTTTHSCERAMYCTHMSVWSVELWASAAAMCCAPFAPMELYSSLYAHACERRAIQPTCVAHDA